MDLTTPLTWDDILALYRRLGRAHSPGQPAAARKILSVYLELPPDVRHERRRWLSTLNSGLREIRARHPDDRDLDRLAELVAQEVKGYAPEARGRSLVYFATSEGHQWQRSLQLSTGTRFVWHSQPVLSPLVSALDGAPVTGAVVLAQDKARFLTWRQGLMHEDKVLQADLDTSDWRRFASGTVNATGQQTSTHTDDFQARFDEQIDRFVRSLAAQVAEEARDHSWELIMLTAAPKLSEVLASALPSAWRERLLPPGDINLMRAGLMELGDHLTNLVGAWNAARHSTEVRRVLSVAEARGAAATGPQACLDLLAQHRVGHLYFAADLELSGYARPDGVYNLYPSPDRPDAQIEPHLTEWMIGVCLESGARVTPVAGEAAELLAGAGGMAAALRY